MAKKTLTSSLAAPALERVRARRITRTYSRPDAGAATQGNFDAGDVFEAETGVRAGFRRFYVVTRGTGVLCGALWVRADDVEPVAVTAPVIAPAPPAPSAPAPSAPAAGNFVGMHDFPAPDYWHTPARRGWVLHTARMNEQLPGMLMSEHRANGGRVLVRFNWDYGETVPRDLSRVPAFVTWVASQVQRHGAEMDAVQIGNEPDIELQNLPADHLARVHNDVSRRVLEHAPRMLISPAPLGWMMPIANAHPREYFRRLWQLIEPRHKTMAVLHAYRHGAGGDANQMFRDWPLTGMFYNERIIENQLAELAALGHAQTPVVIGEFNYGAPERAHEPDAWQDRDGGATLAMLRYFAAVPANIIAAIPFRWRNDNIHGRSYGIDGRHGVIARLREAQALHLKGMR